jgi:hypothetical protein
MAYMHILAFRILSCENELKGEMIPYAKKTKLWYGFDKWHTNENDLYYCVHVLLNYEDEELNLSDPTIHSLSKVEFSETKFLDILKAYTLDNGVADIYFRRYLLHIDNDMKVVGSSLRSIRRLVMNWPDIGKKEKRLAITRLIQFMNARCNMSDLLMILKRFARDNDLEMKETESKDNSPTFKHLLKLHKLSEEDGGIATTSADIAPVVKPLGKVRKRSN